VCSSDLAKARSSACRAEVRQEGNVFIGDGACHLQPINEEPDASGDDGRHTHLDQQPGTNRRTGFRAGGNLFLALMLGTNAPGQNRKKREPPDDEVDRDPGNRVHETQACSSSTSVPFRSFGCRKTTGLPCAPIFGLPVPVMVTPSAFIFSQAASMSSTSMQM